MKPLTIAIDFDDTFTASPGLFAEFIRLAKARGHQTYIVTARAGTVREIEWINSLLDDEDCQCPIVCTNRGSKLDAMEQRGIKVDIWIDDEPRKLVHGY